MFLEFSAFLTRLSSSVAVYLGSFRSKIDACVLSTQHVTMRIVGTCALRVRRDVKICTRAVSGRLGSPGEGRWGGNTVPSLHGTAPDFFLRMSFLDHSTVCSMSSRTCIESNDKKMACAPW